MAVLFVQMVQMLNGLSKADAGLDLFMGVREVFPCDALAPPTATQSCLDSTLHPHQSLLDAQPFETMDVLPPTAAARSC